MSNEIYAIYVRRDWPHPKRRQPQNMYFTIHLVELDTAQVVLRKLTDKPVSSSPVNPKYKLFKRIIKSWKHCYYGRTKRCAYRKAVDEARAFIDQQGGYNFQDWFNYDGHLVRGGAYYLHGGIALPEKFSA